MSVHLFCGSERNLSVLRMNSLRSKRFQSSYCAKVRAEAKIRLKEEGEGKRLLRRLKNEKLLN